MVQGVQDAARNGVTIGNGTQVAAGLLGLGANVHAAKGLTQSILAKKVDPSNYTAFQADAERIMWQASTTRGLTPNATAAAMTKADVDIARLSPPDTRPFADPVKLQKLGAFDWNKYNPIEVDKVGDRLIIQNGMTRVEAARQAGITILPAYVFENK